MVGSILSTLSLPERVNLLKLWILPLLVYPARVVFPSSAVVSTLATIYQVALNLNSWGLTLDILAHPPTKGGYSLAPPQTFLYWQHSTPFVNYANNSLSMPQQLVSSFQAFAQELGILVSPSTLPYFQMGSNVTWATMPYLERSARAFWPAKTDVHFQVLDLLSYDTPMWHTILFRDQRALTYFAPRLIRQGIPTIGQLLEDDFL